MSIENEIASLTQSTTGLLTAVNTKKAILDTAVTNAEAAATDSTAQAVTSTSAKNSSEAARDAAVVAKNAANTSALNAAAVVTGGTATVAPQAGKIPLADSEGNIADGWLSPESKAMGKSEFFALAEKRIRDGAGSGFAEWGKHNVSTNEAAINQGLSSSESNPNEIRLGRRPSDAEGTSRSAYPITFVNGSSHLISHVNGTDIANVVKLPNAPNGTKTYDSATGAVVTHASAAEAFDKEEPLINGLNWVGALGSTPPDNWNYSGANAQFNVANGILTYDRNGDGTDNLRQTFNTVVGESYTLNIDYISSTSSAGLVLLVTGYTFNTSSLGFHTFTFEATSNQTEILLRPSSNSYQIIELGKLTIKHQSLKVITSRQDFGFLESFHEKISDKDVVYPLGNVQYGATTWEGISLSTSVAAQGYSAFGDWDTSTTGRGVVWSTLSAANKAKFIEDPENNIYSDGDDLIQVRYRVRVVEGVNDNWENASDTLSLLICNTGSATRYVSPRGYRDGAQGDLTTGAGNNSFAQSGTLGNWKTLRTNTAHNGLCFAVPLFLVQRRNQGAYHPVYNSEGTALLQHKTLYVSNPTYAYRWYKGDAYLPKTTSEVFARSVYTRGFIGTISGRPDDKFYDAIYASDVQDLRMSSKSLPLAELREKYKRMAIAGEVRGFEAVPFTKVYTASLTGGNTLTAQTNNTASNLTLNVLSELGNIGYVEQLDGSYIRAVDGSTSDYFHMESDGTPHDRFEGQRVVLETKQTHSQANPTWTDIMGDPTNIAATFPDGVEGQWVPYLTGNDIPLNRKALNSLDREYSTNNGVSWSYSASIGLDSTLNTGFGYLNIEPNRVTLAHYETQAHFTEDAVNSKVLDLGDVFAGGNDAVVLGNVLQSSLTGVVGTEPGAKDSFFNGLLLQNSSSFYNNKLESSSWNGPNRHDVISIPNGGSSSIKALDYLSSENNVAKLMYAYKEMVYDSGALGGTFTDRLESETGTIAINQQYHITNGRFIGYWVVVRGSGSHTALSDNRWGLNSNGDIIWENGEAYYAKWDGNGWGDNNQFEITNNQATQTDDNGNTVKYGTASFNTQYFVVEE